MSEAKLYSFKGSIFEQRNPQDFTFLRSMSRSFFDRVTKQFVIFTDYYNFDKYSSVIADLKSNTHFKGIILNIDRDIFTLSQRLLTEDFGKSILRKMATVEDLKVINRFIHAWKIGAQNDLIADFKVNHRNQFYLLDCSLNLSQGNLGGIDLFSNATNEQIQKMEIDEHGNFIFWEDLDYHLDLGFFKGELDQEFKKKQIAKSLERNKNLGLKMKLFRESKGVTQGSFENISDKQIRRYESGAMYPTFKSLTSIAKRFDLTVTQYLEQVQAMEPAGERANEPEESPAR